MNFYRLKFWRFYILSSHFTGVNIPTGRFGVELHFSFYPPLLQSSVLLSFSFSFFRPTVLHLFLLLSYFSVIFSSIRPTCSTASPSSILLSFSFLSPSCLSFVFSSFRPTCSTASPSSVLLSFSFLSFRPTCPSSSPPFVLLVLQLLLLPSYLSFIFSSFRPTCPSASPPSVLLVLQPRRLPSYLSFIFSSFRPTCPSYSPPSDLNVLSSFRPNCPSSFPPSVLFVLHLLVLLSYVSFIFLPSYFPLSFIFSSFQPTHLCMYPSFCTPTCLSSFIFSFFRPTCPLYFPSSVLHVLYPSSFPSYFYK